MGLGWGANENYGGTTPRDKKKGGEEKKDSKMEFIRYRIIRSSIYQNTYTYIDTYPSHPIPLHRALPDNRTGGKKRKRRTKTQNKGRKRIPPQLSLTHPIDQSDASRNMCGFIPPPRPRHHTTLIVPASSIPRPYPHRITEQRPKSPAAPPLASSRGRKNSSKRRRRSKIRIRKRLYPLLL